jgi:ribosomal protein S12 methylthiotransferase
VDGAAANALPDPVPEDVREERRARFMATQERISAARLARKVGTTMTVLVDEIDGDVAVARSTADAPEIDGVVRIANAGGLRAGDFATVEITGADAHDLAARRFS